MLLYKTYHKKSNIESSFNSSLFIFSLWTTFCSQSTEEAIKLADEIGYPVMIKVCLTSWQTKSTNVITCSFNWRHDLIGSIDVHASQRDVTWPISNKILQRILGLT